MSIPSPSASPALPSHFTRPPVHLLHSRYVKPRARKRQKGQSSIRGRYFCPRSLYDAREESSPTFHTGRRLQHRHPRWFYPDNAVVIDDNEPGPAASPSPPPRKTGPAASSAADQSFNLGTLDPDLASLLSPTRLSDSKTHIKRLSIVYPLVIDLSQPSPVSGHFPPSPWGSSPGLTPSPSSQTFTPGGGSSSGSLKPAARTLPPKQQSSSADVAFSVRDDCQGYGIRLSGGRK